jgi:hypothetical protein
MKTINSALLLLSVLMMCVSCGKGSLEEGDTGESYTFIVMSNLLPISSAHARGEELVNLGGGDEIGGQQEVKVNLAPIESGFKNSAFPRAALRKVALADRRGAGEFAVGVARVGQAYEVSDLTRNTRNSSLSAEVLASFHATAKESFGEAAIVKVDKNINIDDENSYLAINMVCDGKSYVYYKSIPENREISIPKMTNCELGYVERADGNKAILDLAEAKGKIDATPNSIASLNYIALKASGSSIQTLAEFRNKKVEASGVALGTTNSNEISSIMNQLMASLLEVVPPSKRKSLLPIIQSCMGRIASTALNRDFKISDIEPSKITDWADEASCDSSIFDRSEQLGGELGFGGGLYVDEYQGIDPGIGATIGR